MAISNALNTLCGYGTESSEEDEEDKSVKKEDKPVEILMQEDGKIFCRFHILCVIITLCFTMRTPIILILNSILYCCS